MASNDLIGPMDEGGSVPSTPLVEESTNPSIECTETAPTPCAKSPLIDSSSVHTKKLTSNVWLEFDKKIDDKDKATCRSCKKVLNACSANGTSNLRKYLLNCPRRSNRDPRQMFLDKAKKSSDGSSTLGNYNFNLVASRTDLANMIVLHEYPLSIVDHVGFRTYSQGLQPLFKVPTRNTIKRHIIKMYKQKMVKLMQDIDFNSSRIAVTTDMWTSDHQRKGYMAITGHYIDETWNLQKLIIRFCYVPAPHTREVIAEKLITCLLDWNIDKKLTCLTVDNCSTNEGLVGEIIAKIGSGELILGGSFCHMRCCAYILNLIVQDGLSLINEAIKKVRHIVQFWTATTKRLKKFEESARQLRIPSSKKLSLDCKTRWNSTYLMLEVAVKNNEVFYRLQQRENKLALRRKDVPSEDDWTNCEKNCEKLKIFYETTLLFSGSTFVTSNLGFPKICEIRLALMEWCCSPDQMISSMASEMLVKFKKYWDTTNEVLGVGSVLDPRYKLCLLEFYFEKIYGEEKVESEVDRVRKVCYALLHEYQTKSSSALETDGSSVMT